MKFLMNKNFWLSFLQPYLIAIYPAVMVAGGNLGQFYLGELLILVCMLFFITQFFYISLGFIYKGWNKSSLILSLVLIFFYGFHHFANAYLIPVAIFTQKYFFKFQVRYSFFLAIVLLTYLFFKLFKIKSVHNIFSRILILPLIILYFFMVLKVFSFYGLLNNQIENWDKLQQKFQETHLSINSNKINSKPDIYYIILDTYTSQNALQKYRNWDISWFFNRLKDKDFYVAENSFSNYGCTEISLSSSLNMSHHDNFPRELFYGFLHHQIRNNNVVNFLKKLDYKYVYIGYDMPFEIENLEQQNKFVKIKDYFVKSFYDMTRPFGYLPCVLGGWSLWFYHWTKLEFLRHRNVILNNLKNLKMAINIESPKFVFAHIECPHGPNVFDKNGNYVRNKKNGYAEQVEFISKRIDKIIDLILKRNKNTIVILQGDHGEAITGMFAGGNVERAVDFEHQIKRAFPILNAYYLPNPSIHPSSSRGNSVTSPETQGEQGILYNKISPVNSFRVLFNKYFGTNLKLLNDNSFIGHDKDGQLYNVNNFRD